MIRKAIMVFLLIIGSTAKGAETATPPHPVIDTARLVEVFYAAVDRNELKISGMTMTRSMVKPVEITYSYDLQGRQKTILVISNIITERLLCPYNKDFYIHSVTARLNNSGYIIEVWHDMRSVN